MLVNWDKIVQTKALKYYKPKFRASYDETDHNIISRIESFLKYTKLAKAVTLMKVSKGVLLCGHSDCGKIVRDMMQREHEFIVSLGITEGLNNRAREGVVYKVLDALVRSTTWTDESTKRTVQATLQNSDVLINNKRTYFGVSRPAVVSQQFLKPETDAGTAGTVTGSATGSAGSATGPAGSATGMTGTATGTAGPATGGGNKTLRGGGWRADFTRRIRR